MHIIVLEDRTLHECHLTLLVRVLAKYADSVVVGIVVVKL
jgi:hypothetical protein